MSPTKKLQAACLSKMVSDVYDAQNLDEIRKILSEGFGALGYDNFILSINASDKYEMMEAPTLTTWPDNLRKEFFRLRFAEFDPLTARNITATRPFRFTRSFIPSYYRNAAERRFIEFLRNSPVGSGITIPLPHDPGQISAMTLTSSQDVKHTAETAHYASVIGRVTLMKAASLNIRSDDASNRLADAGLSRPQTEILHWAAQGKSNADIAFIIGMSKRSVDYHMGRILRKLQVATRTQAAAFVGKNVD